MPFQWCKTSMSIVFFFKTWSKKTKTKIITSQSFILFNRNDKEKKKNFLRTLKFGSTNVKWCENVKGRCSCWWNRRIKTKTKAKRIALSRNKKELENISNCLMRTLRLKKKIWIWGNRPIQFNNSFRSYWKTKNIDKVRRTDWSFFSPSSSFNSISLKSSRALFNRLIIRDESSSFVSFSFSTRKLLMVSIRRQSTFRDQLRLKILINSINRIENFVDHVIFFRGDNYSSTKRFLEHISQRCQFTFVFFMYFVFWLKKNKKSMRNSLIFEIFIRKETRTMIESIWKISKRRTKRFCFVNRIFCLFGLRVKDDFFNEVNFL